MLKKLIYKVELTMKDNTLSNVFIIAINKIKVKEFIQTDSRFKEHTHCYIQEVSEDDIPENSCAIALMEQEDLKDIAAGIN